MRSAWVCIAVQQQGSLALPCLAGVSYCPAVDGELIMHGACSASDGWALGLNRRASGEFWEACYAVLTPSGG